MASLSLRLAVGTAIGVALTFMPFLLFSTGKLRLHLIGPYENSPPRVFVQLNKEDRIFSMTLFLREMVGKNHSLKAEMDLTTASQTRHRVAINQFVPDTTGRDYSQIAAVAYLPDAVAADEATWHGATIRFTVRFESDEVLVFVGRIDLVMNEIVNLKTEGATPTD